MIENKSNCRGWKRLKFNIVSELQGRRFILDSVLRPVNLALYIQSHQSEFSIGAEPWTAKWANVIWKWHKQLIFQTNNPSSADRELLADKAGARVNDSHAGRVRIQIGCMPKQEESFLPALINYILIHVCITFLLIVCYFLPVPLFDGAHTFDANDLSRI